MKLSEYIEHLTSQMEQHQAQDYEVKTRYPMLDRWGQYDGEGVENVTTEQFCIDDEAKIAFVDCDATDLKPLNEMIEQYKSGHIETT